MNNDSRIPQSVYRLKNNIVFGVGTTLFVFLFAVIYTPTFGFDTPDTWYAHSSLTIPVTAVIVAAVIAVSRMLLLLTTRRLRLRPLEYLVWQVGEVAVIGIFANLFVSIFFRLNYFRMLPTALLIAVAILAFPYIVYWLFIELSDRTAQLVATTIELAELQQSATTGEGVTMRFADEKGVVRLVVGSANVIAVESSGNYVTITCVSLRNSLKNVEDLCRVASLVRCHRSYFINLRRVKLLRKDSDAIYAEIDAPGVADIPVSKTYSAEVVKLFGAL